MEKDKTPSNDSANYYGGLEGMSAKQFLGAIVSMRSEERRVGKECG